MDLLVSGTFSRQFRRLSSQMQARVRRALDSLADDPRRARPGCDIKRLAGVDPATYRLRVGDWRLIYRVTSRRVEIGDLVHRGRGYRLD